MLGVSSTDIRYLRTLMRIIILSIEYTVEPSLARSYSAKPTVFMGMDY